MPVKCQTARVVDVGGKRTERASRRKPVDHVSDWVGDEEIARAVESQPKRPGQIRGKRAARTVRGKPVNPAPLVTGIKTDDRAGIRDIEILRIGRTKQQYSQADDRSYA